MDLRDYAAERLSGIDGQDRAHYTRGINAVHGRFPTVEAVRAATDEQLMGHGLGIAGLAYLRELVEQDEQTEQPKSASGGTVKRSDQTVGPPWQYDETFRSISGRKCGTGGKVTVAALRYRAPGEEKLYFPLTEQADTLGRELAAMLNERQVFVQDPR